MNNWSMEYMKRRKAYERRQRIDGIIATVSTGFLLIICLYGAMIITG